MFEKRHFLSICFDKSQVDGGHGNRKGYAGKTSARADVDNTGVWGGDERRCGQRIQKVAGHDMLDRTVCNQIGLGIPAAKLGRVSAETIQGGFVKPQAQGFGFALKKTHVFFHERDITKITCSGKH